MSKPRAAPTPSELKRLVEQLAQELDSLEKRASAHETDEEKDVLNHLYPLSCEPRNFYLARLLRAHRGSLDATRADVAALAKWRREVGADEIGKLTSLHRVLPSNIDPMDLASKFPVIERGRDREGRPVLYMLGARFDARGLLRICGGDVEVFMRYQIWLRERSFARLFSLNYSPPASSPYFTVVLDLQGVRLSQCTTEFYAVLKRVVELDQSCYPGRVGRMIIVHAPFFFGMIWQALKSWLGPSIEKKVVVLSAGHDAKQRSLLSSLVDDKNLPADFGGKAPRLPRHDASKEELYCKMVHFEDPTVRPVLLSSLLPEAEEEEEEEEEARGDAQEAASEQPPPEANASLNVASEESPKEAEEENERVTKDDERSAVEAPPAEPASSAAGLDRLLETSARSAELTQEERLSHIDALVEAIEEVRRATDAFERDAIAIRRRFRARRLAASAAEERRAAAPVVDASDRASLEAEILSVAHERDALDRAVAFARNYIEVETASRARVEAEWTDRLRALEHANRGLRSATLATLGPVALKKILNGGL